MDLPESRQRRRQLEMAPEAAEARLVRQAVRRQSQMLFEQLSLLGIADVEALALSAFPAADVDEHGGV